MEPYQHQNMELQKDRLLFRRASIKLRLPLFICALVLSVITIYSWLAYRGVKDAAFEVGRERLKSLTEQLSSLFQQSARSLAAATRGVAREKPFQEFLLSNGKRSRKEALAALGKPGPARDSLSFFELRDLRQQPVLSLTADTMFFSARLDSEIVLASRGPDFSSFGHLRPVGKFIYYPVVIAVTNEDQPIGYLVRWRRSSTTAQARDQLSQLLGTKAALYFANKDQSLWTDLVSIVQRPPLDSVSFTSVVEYTRNKDTEVVALARPIIGTPWIILVEFPREAVLAAVNRFVQGISIVGFVVLLFGFLAAWVLSRSITVPLDRFTLAVEKITQGNFSQPVHITSHDEFGKLASAFNTMAVQVQESQYQLEKKVQERTSQLEATNKELEAFSYSVSHDLRAPLRHMDGFAGLLSRRSSIEADEEARRYLSSISQSAKHMGQLIDELLIFSRMGRAEIQTAPLEMASIVREVIESFVDETNGRDIRWNIQTLPVTFADPTMIRLVWQNLLGNALKYSRPRKQTVIEIGARDQNTDIVFFVRDNGVGFDMKYAGKLFGVFQRLHRSEEFEGTGIGLANVQRIILRHGGKVWAEGAKDRGATFYFSLPATTPRKQS